MKGQSSKLASSSPLHWLPLGQRKGEIKRRLREEALQKQGYKCLYCLRELSALDATLDHFLPKIGGGRLRGNAVAACFACNHNKADMDGEEVLRLVSSEMPPPKGNGKIRSIWRRRQHHLKPHALLALGEKP